MFCYFLLSDQKKVTKEKSPAAENYLKLFSLYRKITRHAWCAPLVRFAWLKQIFLCWFCSN